MSFTDTNASIVGRSILGVVASISLTAGATSALAAELLRGFTPVFDAIEERQHAATLPVGSPSAPRSLQPMPGDPVHVSGLLGS